ncbi:CoA transferase [Rhodococcus zopfii]|uniref:CoA transferase n=1 Tax=Rhodococcus zopfii TaxID=43772 RepID=UPI000AE86B3E
MTVSDSRLPHDYAKALAGAGLDAAPAGDVECPAPGALLSARLPVFALAAGAVAVFAQAANRVRAAAGVPSRPIRLDPERIAASFSGDRMLRLSGTPVDGFADLSGFFRVRDGWVRTHANYPHHRSRLLRALNVPADASRHEVVERLCGLDAAEVEAAAVAHDAIAVQVRSEAQWRASAAGCAVAAEPLVAVTARPDSGRPAGTAATAAAPLAGVRVLDTTRVIAGPVASRALALLGATVLRIDPPHLPEIAWQHLENGQGKHSALLDLRDRRDAATFRALLADADILLGGYRPGALEALIGDIGAIRPGLLRGRVCAWGRTGPWSGRRGFDSIVQAASGIAVVESGGDGPGALPAQALDHASGYLLAAGVLDACAIGDGVGRDVTVSLARTGSWLLGAPGRRPDPPLPVAPGEATVAIHGAVTAARPAVADYADHPFPARPWGGDPPCWPTPPPTRVR